MGDLMVNNPTAPRAMSSTTYKRFDRRPVLVSLCLVILMVFISQATVKAASDAGILTEQAERCRKELDLSAQDRRYRHKWLQCIHLYEKLGTTFPGSDPAAKAIYQSGLLYSRLYIYSGREDDLDKALASFRKLVDEYQDHRLADDAQYRIGEIYYSKKNNPSQAYVEFLKVDIKFPLGDMRPMARRMMDKLTVELKKKEGQEAKKDEAPSEKTMTRVRDIRHWSTPTYTRIVIDLERPVKYISQLLQEDPKHGKPRRLYLDLERTFVAKDIDTVIPIRDGLLQGARAGQYSEDKVRVVLDIESIGGYKVFHLFDPFRIVVDVRGIEKKEVEKTKQIPKATTRSARKGIRKAEKPSEKLSLARQLGLGVKRIVIDPGHGGKDPGTFHNDGVNEKAIVLNLAKKVAARIEQKLGCEVFLTRTKDQFLSLEDRTAFANVKKGDLFISLHVNSYSTGNINGVETYFLNMATDERAVRLAAAENATSEKNISDLQAILNELMLNTKINESSRLAHEVQGGVIRAVGKKYKDVKSLGVKQAPFYVLIGAEMPAILIETGFITNLAERDRLTNDAYLDILSDGITGGIDSYMRSIEASASRGG